MGIVKQTITESKNYISRFSIVYKNIAARHVMVRMAGLLRI